MWPKYKLEKSFGDLIRFHLRNIISLDKHVSRKYIFVPSARYAIVNILKCFDFNKESKIKI